ncbi:MAG: hypothetical protein K2H91_10940, partial [Lachnospiraceae bacterium]|nr:hypothetical protein [Lachnospiraceae bacterium]
TSMHDGYYRPAVVISDRGGSDDVVLDSFSRACFLSACINKGGVITDLNKRDCSCFGTGKQEKPGRSCR